MYSAPNQRSPCSFKGALLKLSDFENLESSSPPEVNTRPDRDQDNSQPKQGQAKFGWVMNRLAKRFPEAEWETLSEYVEQAVLHMNASKRARGSGLNGKHDA